MVCPPPTHYPSDPTTQTSFLPHKTAAQVLCGLFTVIKLKGLRNQRSKHHHGKYTAAWLEGRLRFESETGNRGRRLINVLL